MSKLIYVLKKIKSMDKKAMINKINIVHEKTNMSRFKIFLDMNKCAKRYLAGYMDYDLFEMYNLTDEQRDTYLTVGRNNELVKKYCDYSVIEYFRSKAKFYKKFNKYLKRDWLDLNEATKEEVTSLLKKHKDIIVKPSNGCCGKGIEKLNTSDFENLDTMYEYLISDSKDKVIEEVLIQHEDISSIYPGSVNTVRVVTVVTTENNKSLLELSDAERKKAKLVSHVICTYFRIGNNGKHVDNFNSGGMAVPVDVETGIVNKVAIDKEKNVYSTHPATGKDIVGFKFKYWREALEMCKKASLEIPLMGYVGWDVAFSKDGPLLIEGNDYPGHDIYQLPVHTPEKIGMMLKFKFE